MPGNDVTGPVGRPSGEADTSPDRGAAGGVRPDGLTLAAFAVLVVLIAANVLAVRFTDRVLPPFWGGGTRLGTAALAFFAYVAARRVPMPRGRDLAGALAFGVVQFGLGFGLGYWSLVELPASVVGIILASIPLFTIGIAALAGIEPLRGRGVVGSLISIAGIAIMLDVRAGGQISWLHLVASLGFAACLAAGLVIAKALPNVRPAALNAIGMAVGASMLVAASVFLGESRPLPAATAVWAVQLYVVAAGSVGVFALMLFVVRRWTATGASYQTVLSPAITILLAAWLLGEPVSWSLLVGGAVVIAGVYVGALWHGRMSAPVSTGAPGEAAGR